MGVWLGPRGGKVAPIEIYNAGDQNTFTPVAYAFPECSGTAPEVTYNNDSLYIKVAERKYGGANSGVAVRSEAIDLTKYNKISIHYDWRAGGWLRFCASTSPTDFSNATMLQFNSRENPEAGGLNKDAELDVSSLRGNYYFGIALTSWYGYGDADISVHSVTATK